MKEILYLLLSDFSNNDKIITWISIMTLWNSVILRDFYSIIEK